MKWNKFRLKTTTEAEDIVSSMLMDLGIQGVEIEDKVPLTSQDKEQMFVDILHQMPEDDGTAFLTFYLEEEEDPAEMLGKVQKELEEMRAYVNVGECTIEESQTEDVDWVNNWKQYFHQFYIDDILVIPSWEQVEEKDKSKLVIHIDPGTAFGTGMHETTQLCIRELKKYVTRDTKILDVGCGSGILSIAALKLGAAEATAVDIDDKCLDVAYENAALNGIGRDTYTVRIGDVLGDEALRAELGGWQMVVANIVADVIKGLSPLVRPMLARGGWFLCAGIIDDRAEEVADCLRANGWEIVETRSAEGWFSYLCR